MLELTNLTVQNRLTVKVDNIFFFYFAYIRVGHLSNIEPRKEK